MAKRVVGARRSLVCLAVLYQLGLLAWDFTGGVSRVVRRAQPDAKTNVLAKDPPVAEELKLSNSTEGALETELKQDFGAEESKESRAARKTAETKERVAEKKRRLESAQGSEDSMIDWAEYAKQAREMAAEAAKDAAKPGKESAAARAKELALGFVASGLDSAAEAPILVPASAAALVVVLAALMFGRPAPEPRPAPVRQAAPVVLSKAQPSLKAETPAAVPAAPVPVRPAPAPAPAPPTKQDLPWARSLAKSARDTLKSVAEELPAAESLVEEELPVAESAFNWVSSITPENAPEKIEKDALPAAARFAGEVLKAGLRAGSVGLDFASQNLPAAEEALGKAVEKGLPVAQSALRDAASGARSLATEGLPGSETPPSNSVLRALVEAAPGVLSNTAKVLDATADAAPQVTSGVGQAVSVVTPIAQATLGVASDLAEGVSNIPGSAVEQAAGKLADTVKSSIPPDAASNAKQLVEKAASAVMTPKK
ncbi:unnamed protein product [Symbiodinium necroappetens]|uniref:Uncharacterized protein n=1 Tax=Symbiodinium necroappetens TaxID=1628268 RepID=A0A812QWT4_9DINO|nr:unnamed protein product [Symbiodinium necroappetens]